MTRKSKREIERDLEELNGENDPSLTRPFTAAEREHLAETGIDVARWGATEMRRAMLRSLAAVAAEGNP